MVCKILFWVFLVVISISDGYPQDGGEDETEEPPPKVEVAATEKEDDKKETTKDEDRLKRFLIDEDFKPAIFGSYHFDPIKQEFAVKRKKKDHDCESEVKKMTISNSKRQIGRLGSDFVLANNENEYQVTNTTSSPATNKLPTTVTKQTHNRGSINSTNSEGKIGNITTNINVLVSYGGKVENKTEEIESKRYWRPILSEKIISGTTKQKDDYLWAEENSDLANDIAAVVKELRTNPTTEVDQNDDNTRDPDRFKFFYRASSVPTVSGKTQVTYYVDSHEQI